MNFFFSKLLDKAEFDFVKYKTFSFTLSITLIVAALLLVSFRGINFGIDFSGGLIFEFSSQKEINLAELENKLLMQKKLGSVSLQHLNNKKSALIKTKSHNGDQDIDIVKSLFKDYDFQYQKIDYVGPQISQGLIKISVIALVFALVAIFIYLSFRFDIKIGFGGATSLVHDAIIVCGIYSLFAIEFRVSSVAALLTIIGYSINDSVVIFDKIRENSRRIKNKANLVNISINKTLSRTTLTSITTMIAVLPIMFFSGGEVADFATMILVGIIIGTYSSIFIAAPMTLIGVKNANQT